MKNLLSILILVSLVGCTYTYKVEGEVLETGLNSCKNIDSKIVLIKLSVDKASFHCSNGANYIYKKPYSESLFDKHGSVDKQ